MKNYRRKEKLVFRLYITEHAPSSQRAVSNFKAISQGYFPNNYELEIVDTVQQPLRAMQDGIVITPTLVKLAPEPTWSVVGDLSEDARVLASMNGDGHIGTESAVRSPQFSGGKHAAVKRRARTTDPRTVRSTRSGMSAARTQGE